MNQSQEKPNTVKFYVLLWAFLAVVHLMATWLTIVISVIWWTQCCEGTAMRADVDVSPPLLKFLTKVGEVLMWPVSMLFKSGTGSPELITALNSCAIAYLITRAVHWWQTSKHRSAYSGEA